MCLDNFVQVKERKVERKEGKKRGEGIERKQTEKKDLKKGNTKGGTQPALQGLAVNWIMMCLDNFVQVKERRVE